jgi:multiple sugar transport system permease protein
VVGSDRGGVVRTAALVAVAVVFLAPLVLVGLGSFRPVGSAPPRIGELFAGPWSTGSYGELQRLLPIGRPFLNSILVAAVAVPLGVLVASWAGFAVARLSGRSGTFLAASAVLVLLIPVTALFVGRLTVFRWLGLTDTLVPLMATGLLGVSPVFVLVFAWSYRRLPAALFDITTEFGLSPVAAWWRVALPLTKGVTAGVAAVAFVLTWNDYLGPLIYVSDQRRATLALAIGTLSSLDGPRQPVMLAGAVLAIVPVLIVVCLLVTRVREPGGNRP